LGSQQEKFGAHRKTNLAFNYKDFDPINPAYSVVAEVFE